ncbi:MAG: major facilitator superfamily 1 [Acidobacteria bacterium]|nr:major facilitator superfamily 1 [Acidobacteriota bacterium]
MIKEEIHLSAAQLGVMLSSFFWANTLCLLPVGWLIDRFDVTWILAIGFVLWSAATSVTGVLHGFTALLVARMILGIGESVAYPAYSKILAAHFREQHRGLANAIIGAGQASGPAVATFAGGMLIAQFGWRPFFLLLGLISLAWVPFWLRWRPRDAKIDAAHRVTRSGILSVLRHRSAWGTFVGLFGANYILYLLVTWLPFYLAHERHFSLVATGEIGGILFVLKAISSLTSGRYSDRWIASGATPTLVRKTFLGVGLTCAGVLLVLAAVSADRTCVVLLLGSGVTLGLATPHYWAVSQTLAGQQLAGTWASLQAFVGSFGGILAPLVTGVVVERTGHFLWAFVVTALVGWVAALCWIFVVGSITQVVGLEALRLREPASA